MKNVVVAALTVGAALLAAAGTGQAGEPDQPGQPEWAGKVQLNADTAVTIGRVGNYQNDDDNLALGGCLAPGSTTLNAPAGAKFSSPVLTFSDYSYVQLVSAPGNLTATAKLAPGTPPGTYPLTLDCVGQRSTTTFVVHAKQVHAVPRGAAKAGGGGTAR
ncbi:hypothetical protein [Amycolatopsis minnesotensis]|uniref:Secreted protein n=1 Tax=Amycolatopsis minnesotensis TaxID=337894 RepID=A0ABN2RV27_9PSEU